MQVVDREVDGRIPAWDAPEPDRDDSQRAEGGDPGERERDAAEVRGDARENVVKPDRMNLGVPSLTAA